MKKKSEIIDAGVRQPLRLLLLLSKLDQKLEKSFVVRLPPATIKFQLRFDAFSTRATKTKRNENFKKSFERTLVACLFNFLLFDSDKQITR